jgi:hypothetical protein
MANTIQHKRSNTPSSIPGAGSLSYGELAINYNDGKVYTKNNSNNIINLAASSINGVNIDPGLITTNSGVVINTGGGTARLYASLGGEIDNSDIYFETDSDAPLHVAYKESTTHVGTTAITLNRSSAAQTLSGVSIDGNAGTVTNGVYITGAQSISGVKTFKDRVISDSGPFIIFGTRQNEGNIHLSNTTCNYISFNASGVGAPDGFTRSLGTKIILSPSPGTSSSDMGIGTESNALWFSVPNATYSTKWYSSSTNTATLTGSGVFTVAGATSQINVDNLRLDGNTILATSGDLNLKTFDGTKNIVTENLLEIRAGMTVNTIQSDSILLGGSSNDIDGSIDIRNASDVSKVFIDGLNGIDVRLPLFFIPSTSTTLSVNGQVSFERVSNTQLKILMRGTDGTTRSTTLTLS